MSDPRFERDCLRLITIKSPALKRRGDMTVFAPPDRETLQDIPLIILLHGVYGSRTAVFTDSNGECRVSGQGLG